MFMEFSRGVIIFLGLVICVGCAFGVYKILELILTGAFTGNWFFIIAGGILGYFFFVFLILGVVIGVVIFGIGVME